MDKMKEKLSLSLSSFFFFFFFVFLFYIFPFVKPESLLGPTGPWMFGASFGSSFI